MWPPVQYGHLVRCGHPGAMRPPDAVLPPGAMWSPRAMWPPGAVWPPGVMRPAWCKAMTGVGAGQSQRSFFFPRRRYRPTGRARATARAVQIEPRRYGFGRTPLRGALAPVPSKPCCVRLRTILTMRAHDHHHRLVCRTGSAIEPYCQGSTPTLYYRTVRSHCTGRAVPLPHCLSHSARSRLMKRSIGPHRRRRSSPRVQRMPRHP